MFTYYILEAKGFMLDVLQSLFREEMLDVFQQMHSYFLMKADSTLKCLDVGHPKPLILQLS